MKKISFLISCIAAVALQAQTSYTVDDLILQAMQNAPDLEVSKQNIEAAKSKKRSAYGSYLPNVNLDAAAGKIGQNRLLDPDTMANDTFILGKLSLSQLLYDFGRTGGNVDSLEYEKNAYSMQNRQKIADKIRDVKSAYYTVLRSIALIDVNKENLKLNEAQLYRAQKYFEAGIRTKIDVSDAKVGVINAKIELNKAEYALKLAYANLDKVIGFEALTNNYTVQAQQLDLDNLYESLIPYDLELLEAIKFAYSHRAVLKEYRELTLAKEAQLRAATSEYYPAFYLNADYTKQKLDEMAAFVPKNQWQASVNLQWNLYKGGSSKAQEEEKKVQILISQAQLKNIKLAIKEETTAAFINVAKSKDAVELSQSLLEVSKEKFDQAQKRYEHGLSDYIELQEARQGYIAAKASLVIDYYSYYNSIAILNHAIGR
ncbi:MAG: TolC family protein [Sulfurimonas sp.]